MLRRFFSSLRDYQEECIQTSLDHFNIHGIKRQAVSLPVGAGKTVKISLFSFSSVFTRFPSGHLEQFDIEI